MQTGPRLGSSLLAAYRREFISPTRFRNVAHPVHERLGLAIMTLVGLTLAGLALLALPDVAYAPIATTGTGVPAIGVLFAAVGLAAAIGGLVGLLAVRARGGVAVLLTVLSAAVATVPSGVVAAAPIFAFTVGAYFYAAARVDYAAMRGAPPVRAVQAVVVGGVLLLMALVTSALVQ